MKELITRESYEGTHYDNMVSQKPLLGIEENTRNRQHPTKPGKTMDKAQELENFCQQSL